MKTLEEALGLGVPDQASADTPLEPAKLTVKSLAKGLLHSIQYRESLRRRILADTLPPAVECKLYEYAYGKPVDKVEIRDTTNDLGDKTPEQLELRCLELARLAKKLRGEESEATEVAPGVH